MLHAAWYLLVVVGEGGVLRKGGREGGETDEVII